MSEMHSVEAIDTAVDTQRKDLLIDLVIFDLDDTLYPEIDFVRSGFGAVSRAFATASLPPAYLLAKMEEFYHVDRRHVFDLLAQELAGAREYPCSDPLELSRRMIECYRAHPPEIQLYEDAAVTLESLRNLGIRIGLITDGYWEVQERKVEALGLAGIIELVICTDKLAPGRVYWKPSTRAFEIALGYFGVKPERSCYVGDNPAKDFAGPAALGMKTVWVRRKDGVYYELTGKDLAVGERVRDDLTQRKNTTVRVPTYEVESLTELVMICTGDNLR
ncbi:MAG TPA: HAD family hydrolase [Firmicutes bacterium]|nr:HAD family hydrolase [Bacillota bacterium]